MSSATSVRTTAVETWSALSAEMLGSAGGRLKLLRRCAAPEPARAAALCARAGAQVTDVVVRSPARGALVERGTAEAASRGANCWPGPGPDFPLDAAAERVEFVGAAAVLEACGRPPEERGAAAKARGRARS